ncbi:putative serine/threonine-protein kinase [Zostera marina]|uniref:[RNA-polymerase]-subunit kinase n=1 Tax=Zostera marina TaxID=29655 RepID=A0A0K9PWD2_ZOSMR|nr:putative serine/threonine-protein kinase [Zostera marina]
MGCIFVKGICSGEKTDKVKKNLSSRKDAVNTDVRNSGSTGKEGWLGKKIESKNWEVEHQNQVNLEIVSVSNSFKAESVNAGWPAWLASVAEEAIKGWVPRKANSFQKLNKIGQGTYSSVYKARDLETGRIVALKRVRFSSTNPESVRFMAREIIVLRRLDHVNVIKLEGLITAHSSNSLYLVLEYMEHDLAGLVGTSLIKFSEPQVKCYMRQLLRGLEHCHSRGVLHRDIKGSNLLIDNNGILKLADFGLATFYNPKEKRPSTNRVVTLWYRPPELLLGCIEYDVGVDLWSSGCILGEILSGKPILPGRTEVEQLHKIFRLCGSPSLDYWQRSRYSRAAIFKSSHYYRRCIKETFKGASSTTLALLDTLLAIEPEKRGTSNSALLSEFFTKQPYACHPSSLPKYPPTKELDVKRRDEEAKRRKEAASLKGHGSESMGLERYYGKQNHKSSNKKYQQNNDALSAFLKLADNGTVQNGSSLRRSVSIDYDGNLSFRTLDAENISNSTGFKKEKSLGRHVSGSHSSDFIGMSGSQGYLGNSQSRGGLFFHKKEKKGVVKEATSDYYARHKQVHSSGSLIPKDERNVRRTRNG